MKRAWLIPLGLLLVIAVVYAAPLTSKFFVSGFLTYWTKTDTTLAVSVDTLGLYTQTGLQRKIDSLINLRAGSSIREEQPYHAYVNFSNGTNDSTNLLIYGSYHILPLPFNLYADRAQIETAKPGYDGPTTYRTDLPAINGADSTFILRLSRNDSFAAGQKIGLTLFKVARGTGLSFVNTAGDFYDMIRFDEGEFNAAGTSTQLRVLILLKKNR